MRDKCQIDNKVCVLQMSQMYVRNILLRDFSAKVKKYSHETHVCTLGLHATS